MNDQPSLDERIALLTSLLVDPSDRLAPECETGSCLSGRWRRSYAPTGASMTEVVTRAPGPMETCS